MPSNQQFYDRAQGWLKDRLNWEKKLGKTQLQRFQQDRGKINNQPWPRASNVRWPLSDMIIEKWKPFFFKLIYTSENISNFKALVAANVAHCSGVAHYFDFVVKQKTDFEEEIQLAIDRALQDAECYMKTTWNLEREVPIFEEVQPIFLIVPTGTTNIHDSDCVIHVIQWNKNELKLKFPDLKPSDYERIEEGAADDHRTENDQVNKEEDEYFREGINRTTKDKRIVTWEVHYRDWKNKGEMRLRTISPDDPAIDFGDDREYPYEFCVKNKRWMFEVHKREIVSKKLHSARGIPEVVLDGEMSLTAAWRAKQNAMTIYNNPIWSAPGGIPGSTGNISFRPGQIIPFQIQRADSGPPPMSWDEEMQNTRRIYEERIGVPDFGLGDRNNKTGENRTAREISFIQQMSSAGIDLQAGNWKRYVGLIMKQAWGLIVQYKPKSLLYYINNDMQNLPPEALNDEYLIECSGSAENMNRELRIQKAQTLWQSSNNNPFATPGEAYKNLIEQTYPGQVQRFYRDPQAKEADSRAKAAMDLTVIMTTGFPIPIKPTDDFLVQAQTAMQFLQAQAQKGVGMNPQQVNLISMYIQANREALKRMKPDAYKQLNESMTQAGQPQQQQQQAPAMPGNPAQPQGL